MEEFEILLTQDMLGPVRSGPTYFPGAAGVWKLKNLRAIAVLEIVATAETKRPWVMVHGNATTHLQRKTPAKTRLYHFYNVVDLGHRSHPHIPTRQFLGLGRHTADIVLLLE